MEEDINTKKSRIAVLIVAQLATVDAHDLSCKSRDSFESNEDKGGMDQSEPGTSFSYLTPGCQRIKNLSFDGQQTATTNGITISSVK